MQFFLLDLALAFVVLLGYRAVFAVTQDAVPAVSLDRPHAQPANPRIAPARRNLTPEPVVSKRPPHDGSCESAACRERPPHRLINFW